MGSEAVDMRMGVTSQAQRGGGQGGEGGMGGAERGGERIHGHSKGQEGEREKGKGGGGGSLANSQARSHVRKMILASWWKIPSRMNCLALTGAGGASGSDMGLSPVSGAPCVLQYSKADKV